MQDCLSNGKPLLIENIEEELDPILDPVLEKRFIRQARGLTLQLNDKEVLFVIRLDPRTLNWNYLKDLAILSHSSGACNLNDSFSAVSQAQGSGAARY